MKKILLCLVLCFVCGFATLAFAEKVVRENEVCYLVHFGKGNQDKGITDAQFKDFVAKVVSPAFPVGLTVLEGRGEWTTEKYGFISENTAVVEIFTSNDPKQEKLIEDVANKYIQLFNGKELSVFVAKFPSVITTVIY